MSASRRRGWLLRARRDPGRAPCLTETWERGRTPPRAGSSALGPLSPQQLLSLDPPVLACCCGSSCCLQKPQREISRESGHGALTSDEGRGAAAPAHARLGPVLTSGPGTVEQRPAALLCRRACRRAGGQPCVGGTSESALCLLSQLLQEDKKDQGKT